MPLVRGFLSSLSRALHLTAPVQESTTSKTISTAIDQEDLFRYTSGRWLIDEKYQQEQRFVRFNVENLCSQAAAQFDEQTTCVRIIKREGNFNKAFLLTMNNGNEVIAKIPCPNAGPAALTTASEVATLEFLRSYTSIPVPKVLAWSCDSANPVGAEYIIMEKVPGVALAEKWDGMSALQRYKLIDRIVEMEKELSKLELPAYGSLFFRDSRNLLPKLLPLPSDLDAAGLFGIGPSCNRSVWHNNFDRSGPMPYVGPWNSFAEFAMSIPQRELAFIDRSPDEVEDQLLRSGTAQSVNEYSDLLWKAAEILPVLARDPLIAKGARPVLWHTDLHLGNIFVSPDDPTTVEGIIDWQSTQAAPLFIQARFPEFLQPPKNYKPGTQVPQLPDDFDSLGPEQKDQATKDQALASQSKYYEMCCLGYNKPVYTAMQLDRRLWEPFTCCQLFANGNLVPLRNALLCLSQDWAVLELPGSCPFVFNKEDLKRHNEQAAEFQDRLYLWDIAKTQLCTDDTGWVPMERWEATNEMNRHLFDMYIQTMSEELLPEVAATKWPFPIMSS